MEIDCQTETKPAKTRLSCQIRLGERLCTIFGYGCPSADRGLMFKAFYAFYSFFAFGFLICMFLRTVSSTDWSGGFNSSKAAALVEIVWFIQSGFSAIFFVYNTRRGRFHLLKRHWSTYGADDLIQESNFQSVRWFWICPVLLYFFAVLVAGSVDILLQYYGLTMEYRDGTHAPMQFWELCVHMPIGIFAIVAWAGPLYMFFVVCIHLTYAWRGLSRKIIKISEERSPKWDEKLQCIADSYDQLIALTREVNSLYGIYVLVLLSLCVPELFVQLYFFTCMPSDAIRRGQFFTWMTIGILSVFLFFSASLVHLSAGRVGDFFYECYRRERRNGKEIINDQEFFETSILMTKLYHSPVYISACGFYNITKSALIGIMSLLLTAYCLFFMDANIKLPYFGPKHNLTSDAGL